MFIYIDESGTFSYPRSRKHSYACAGALTIPESMHGGILKSFKTLKRRWGRVRDETKGRELNESQISEIVQLLADRGAKYHACATDMSHSAPASTALRKEVQAQKLSANITESHNPQLVTSLTQIAERLKGISDQLFLQLCVMTELINMQLCDSLIYFAHTNPRELSKFRWIADRKGESKTTYEELWLTLLPGFVHGQQFSGESRNKIVFLKGADYSHCERFFRRLDAWPKHLPEQSPGLRGRTNIPALDLGLLLTESFTLADSRDKPGIQLADILTNALRRALTGHLKLEGWGEIGRLMFWNKGSAVRLLQLGDWNHGDLLLNDKRAAEVLKTIAAKAQCIVRQS